MLNVRCFRPFPFEAIRQVLDGAAVIGVMDRAISFGLGGPLFNEVRSALYGQDRPTVNFIYGLGGRDLSLDETRDAFRALAQVKKTGQPEPETRYIGVRE